MTRRSISSLAALGLLLPLLAACGSSANGGNAGKSNKVAAGQLVGAATRLPKDITKPVPAVPGYVKKIAKAFKGQSIKYYGDGVGIGHDMDVAMAQKFSQQTGIHVTIVIKPQDSNEAYATYERSFSAKSGSIDAMMLDVIWPSALGFGLLPMDKYIGSHKSQYYSTIIKNDTVGGHLVAIPWFGDYGLLYYRTDLLSKYHISGPPKTWTQLAADAKTIQTGEQKTNKAFYGFVFQGKAYEGLTCDALEWIASSGGGDIVDNGKVTLNNPKAAAALNRAATWVGSISPKDVTTYTEVESDNAFNNGNAAFLRNWPYAWAVAQQSPKVKGKVGVTALPSEGGKPSGTVGGWQIGVSKWSKHPGAAAAWALFLTSKPVERWRAIVGSFVPTIPSLSNDPAVQKAEPFLASSKNEIRVVRPSNFFGSKYNQASNIFWQGVSQVLSGSNATSVLPGTAQQLSRLAGH